MDAIQKSEAIKAGLRKGFQDGTSKLVQRRCYGYDIGPNGELVINPDEANIVRWVFDCYLGGNSLGKIAAGLKQKGLPSLTGKPKWSREALSKLLSKTGIMASWNGMFTPKPIGPLFLMRHSMQFRKRNKNGAMPQSIRLQ